MKCFVAMLIILWTFFGVVRADSFVVESEDESRGDTLDEQGENPSASTFELPLVRPFITPFDKDTRRLSPMPRKDKEKVREEAPNSRPEPPPPPPPPTPVHPDIKVFLEGNYVARHCEQPQRCDELIMLDCNYRQEGPVYYFDNVQGETVMTCGVACLDVDPHDPLGCKECPYKAWVACKTRAEKARRALEEAERARKEAEWRAAEAAERAKEEKAERERREQEREIEKKILEAEKDYERRMRELEDAMDQLYNQPVE